jgi:DNA repair photolyase
MKIIHDQRPRKSALGVTSGYLAGYTHTLNPAIGCIFGGTHCGRYCYAQHSMPARTRAVAEGLAWGEFLVLKDGFAEALRDDLRRATERPLEHEHHISKLRIFFSSSTEVCAGPVLATTRDCLRTFAEASAPVGRIVLQTRSPKVIDLLEQILPLRKQLLVSFTMESDSDEAFRGVDLMPRLAGRKRAIEALAEAGIPVSVTVSPCSRLIDPLAFADWIAHIAHCAVVDTFEGDGQHGARTARTETPEIYRTLGWGDFREEKPARALFAALEARLGDRVGWGQDGFSRLAEIPLRFA